MIVRDRGRAVLLCHATFGHEGFWFTPGGGTGPGETARQAATRELAEETGIDVALVAEPVLHRRARFRFLGAWTEQVETFWLAELDHRPRVVSHHLEDYEAATLDDWRWWSQPELADLATREGLYPGCLPDLLAHVDAAPAPGVPWVEEHVTDRATVHRPEDDHALPAWARRP